VYGREVTLLSLLTSICSSSGRCFADRRALSSRQCLGRYSMSNNQEKTDLNRRLLAHNLASDGLQTLLRRLSKSPCQTEFHQTLGGETEARSGKSAVWGLGPRLLFLAEGKLSGR
jgi:hypothetical protein